MNLRRARLVALTLAFAAAPAPAAMAQAPTDSPPGSGPGQAPAQDKPQPGTPGAAQIPPQLRLGLRSEFIRSKLAVLPKVVVVPDAASYIAAIGDWTIQKRYPVLIDDGTWGARNNIARFVRAFKPEDVVRWERKPAEGGPPLEGLPASGAGRRSIIADAAARAWGAPTEAELKARFAALSLEPPGLVLASETDPAWTAALALAAGRGQPIVWTENGGAPGSVPESMTLEQARALAKAAESGAASTGFTWDQAGDQLDAVTICLNVPVKVALPAGNQKQMLALSDYIGRGPDERAGGLWAWSGQIFGSEADAAYRAMSALFLQPRAAWLFDGYETTAPWNLYDMTAAATELERANIASEVHDTPNQSVDDWRTGVARPGTRSQTPREDDAMPKFGLDAGLIAVNTKGYPESFELMPGQAKGADVPVLARPAIVWFVHSFSAANPNNFATIAGRFLHHGAYAYVGSVHEPTLQAFVPTPMLMRRLAARMPLGVAARHDGRNATWPEPWKIAVLGDPLICLGPDAPKAEGDLPLEGTVSLTEQVAENARAKRFDRALEALWLLGRDRDVARLVVALVAQDPTALTSGIARPALSGLFFAGEASSLARAYTTLLDAGVDAGQIPGAQDMIWHAMWPTLRTLRPEEAKALQQAIRWDVNMRDATEAFRATKAAEGDAQARAFAESFKRTLPNDEARTAYEGLLATP